MTLRGAHDRIDRAVLLFASRALPLSLRSGGVGDGRMGLRGLMTGKRAADGIASEGHFSSTQP
jgi:hypothetical protein